MLGGRALTPERLKRERDGLIAEAGAALAANPASVRVSHELRYHGQSFELAVEEEITPAQGRAGLDPDALRARFARAHELRYGYRDDSAEVELVNMRVSVFGPDSPLRPAAAAEDGPATAVRPIVFHGECIDSTVMRGELPPGTPLLGPALCALPEATLLVSPGWSGTVDAQGTIHLAAGTD
jgi:N-methylhydantoinase A